MDSHTENANDRNTFARWCNPPLADGKAESITADVAKEAGSHTLRCFFQGGCCGLSVSMQESQEHPGVVQKVFQAFLNRGYGMSTNEGGGKSVTFPAHSYYNDVLKEYRAINGILETICVEGRRGDPEDPWFLEPNDWHTDYAKHLADVIVHMNKDSVCEWAAEMRCPLYLKEQRLVQKRQYRKLDPDMWDGFLEFHYKMLECEILGKRGRGEKTIVCYSGHAGPTGVCTKRV